jgi:fumarate reductase subunit D
MKTLRRSDEPIWWALFSAGGVCFAVVVPGAILLLGILAPLGLLPTDSGTLPYQHAKSLMTGYFWALPGLAFVVATICLPVFHAAHRIHHGAHDLKIHWGGAGKWLCYGGAALVSFLALYGFYRVL